METMIGALVVVVLVILYDRLGVSAAVTKHIGIPGTVQIFCLCTACALLRAMFMVFS